MYESGAGGGPTAAQMSQFTLELINHYGLGALAEAANIQGASQLKNSAIELMAKVAADYNIDPEMLPETAGPFFPWPGGGYYFETGQAVTWAARLGKAAKGLHSGLQKTLKLASANLPLIFTTGAIYIAHDWLTSDKQVAIANARTLRDTVVSPAWKSMTPKERETIAQAFLGAGQAGPSISTVLLVGLGVVGVALVAKMLKK